ncbi:M15 family metallopeptidase [Caldibacillus debilis]|uniref:M15 family metallopeptidase n=1 Tax=Caldibacillus debilis TaxID=301148 RepID=UPI0007796AD7|nr:M15 family metallopeptidase [Caldibacillus debilis]
MLPGKRGIFLTRKIFILLLTIPLLVACQGLFSKGKEKGETLGPAGQEQKQKENSQDQPGTGAEPSEETGGHPGGNGASGEGEGGDILLDASLFNEIEVINGQKVIKNPDNILIIVNKDYSLPPGYKPKDLVRPKVPFSFGDRDIEKSYMRKEAAEALERMFRAAAKEGIRLYAVSGYRSYERQKELFDAEVAERGKELAVQAVAVPGQSEHQTGLAMDISSASNGFQLNEKFEETLEGKWLFKNAHKFGFILRYPKGKEDITGYMYEPWHYRYVGEYAETIYKNGWTLEEFFEQARAI